MAHIKVWPALALQVIRATTRCCTILANTTIARMYHSEASLLPDGRVLVSGSDPEAAGFTEELRIEVYIPPYLSQGLTQPIVAVPEHGLGLRRTVPDYRAVVPRRGSACLARCGGVQHAWQRHGRSRNLPRGFVRWHSLYGHGAAERESLASRLAPVVCS